MDSSEFSKFDKILRDVGEEGVPPDERVYIDGSGFKFLKKMSSEESEPSSAEELTPDEFGEEAPSEPVVEMDEEEKFVHNLFEDLDSDIDWSNVRTVDDFEEEDWEEEGFDGSQGRDFENEEVFQKVPPPKFIPPKEKERRTLSVDIDSLLNEGESLGLPGSEVEFTEDQKADMQLSEDELSMLDEEDLEEAPAEQPMEEPAEEEIKETAEETLDDEEDLEESLEDIPEAHEEDIEGIPQETPVEEPVSASDDLFEELEGEEEAVPETTEEAEPPAEEQEAATLGDEFDTFLETPVEPEAVDVPPKKELEAEEEIEEEPIEDLSDFEGIEDFEEEIPLEEEQPPIVDEEDLQAAAELEKEIEESEEEPEEYISPEQESPVEEELPGEELEEEEISKLTEEEKEKPPIMLDLDESEISVLQDETPLSIEEESPSELEEIPEEPTLEEPPMEEFVEDEQPAMEISEEEEPQLMEEPEQVEEIEEDLLPSDEIMEEPPEDLLTEEEVLEEPEEIEDLSEESLLEEPLEEDEALEEMEELPDELEEAPPEEDIEEKAPAPPPSDEFEEPEISDAELEALEGTGELPEEEYVPLDEPIPMGEGEAEETEELAVPDEEEPVEEEVSEEEPMEEEVSLEEEMMEEPEAEEYEEEYPDMEEEIEEEPKEEMLELSEEDMAKIQTNLASLPPELSEVATDVIVNEKLPKTELTQLINKLLVDDPDANDIQNFLDKQKSIPTEEIPEPPPEALEKIREKKPFDYGNLLKIGITALLLLIIGGLTFYLIYSRMGNEAIDDSLNRITSSTYPYGNDKLEKEVDNFLYLNDQTPEFSSMLDLARYLIPNHPDLAIKVLLGHSVPSEEDEPTFNGALYYKPSNYEARFLLGDAYRSAAQKQDNVEDSIFYYKKAVYAGNPDPTQLAESGYGFIYYHDQSDIDVLFELGKTYQEMGDQIMDYRSGKYRQLSREKRQEYLEKAREAYNQANIKYSNILNFDPDNIPVHYSILSLMLTQTDDPKLTEKAVNYWNTINSMMDPEGEYLQRDAATKLAGYLIDEEEYDYAGEILEKIIMLDEQNDYEELYPPTLYQYARYQIHKHDLDRAEELLIQFKRYAENPKPWIPVEDREEALEEGLLTTHSTPQSIKSKVNNLLGLIYLEKAKQFKEVDLTGIEQRHLPPTREEYLQMARNHFIAAAIEDRSGILYEPYKNLGNYYYNMIGSTEDPSYEMAMANYEKAKLILSNSNQPPDADINYRLGYLYYNKADEIRRDIYNRVRENRRFNQEDLQLMQRLYHQSLENQAEIYIVDPQHYTNSPSLMRSLGTLNFSLGELKNAQNFYSNYVDYFEQKKQQYIDAPVSSPEEYQVYQRLTEGYNNLGVITTMRGLRENNENLLDIGRINYRLSEENFQLMLDEDYLDLSLIHI